MPWANLKGEGDEDYENSVLFQMTESQKKGPASYADFVNLHMYGLGKKSIQSILNWSKISTAVSYKVHQPINTDNGTLLCYVCTCRWKGSLSTRFLHGACRHKTP